MRKIKYDVHLTFTKCILQPKVLLIDKIPFIFILSNKGQVIMMGFVLLILFAIAEIGFVIFTVIKQKENVQWLKNRIIFRGGEVVLFLLALLFPQVKWDFRFQMCFYVLVIRVLTALVTYKIKKSKASGNKPVSGALVNAVGGIVVVSIALVPAFLFTGYEGIETTGQYDVAQVSAILVDEERVESFEDDGSKREVPVYFYYPDVENAGENSFPLVIFSHGAFGYYQSNTSTYMELASHGYVVISLDHPYHSFFTTDTKGKTITVNPEFLQEVMYINGDTALEEEIVELSHKWLDIRIEDMNFALDSVKEAKADGTYLNEWFIEGEETKNEIAKVLAMTNDEKIGLMGHSLGGATSVTVGRTREDIDAVIDIDGTMLGEELSYENGEYQYYEGEYPIPLLSIDNESHHQQGKILKDIYVNNVVLENAIDGKNTYFVGSGHMNFTDLPLFSPTLSSMLGTGTVDELECIQTMNEVILMYYNCYLKNQGEVIINESY